MDCDHYEATFSWTSGNGVICNNCNKVISFQVALTVLSWQLQEALRELNELKNPVR